MTFKDKEERDKFILDHLWIPRVVVYRYFRLFYTMKDDLIQSGTERLILCVDKYKKQEDATFITYAYRSILLDLKNVCKDYRYGSRIKLCEHRDKEPIDVLSLDYYTEDNDELFDLTDNTNIEHNIACKDLLDSILLYTFNNNESVFLRNKKNKKIIIDYYLKDLKQVDIAKELNMSKQQVNEVIKKYNELIMDKFSEIYYE